MPQAFAFTHHGQMLLEPLLVLQAPFMASAQYAGVPFSSSIPCFCCTFLYLDTFRYTNTYLALQLLTVFSIVTCRAGSQSSSNRLGPVAQECTRLKHLGLCMCTSIMFTQWWNLLPNVLLITYPCHWAVHHCISTKENKTKQKNYKVALHSHARNSVRDQF